jgi:hypothetical protein
MLQNHEYLKKAKTLLFREKEKTYSENRSGGN